MCISMPNLHCFALHAALAAYELASLGRNDVSLAEVHDASAVGEMYETEALGFCEFGGGEYWQRPANPN
jgi:hypothetical protein